VSGRNRKKAKNKGGQAWYESAWLSGLLLLAVALYMGLSLTGAVAPWWLVLDGESITGLSVQENPGGPVGSVLNVVLHLVFGSLWCWVIPVVVGVLGFGFLTGQHASLRPWLLRALPAWLITSAWIAQPGGPASAEAGVKLGGLVGYYLASGFHKIGRASCRERV